MQQVYDQLLPLLLPSARALHLDEDLGIDYVPVLSAPSDIAELSSSESTRGEAMQFFKKEFELDWKLACYSVGAHTFDGSKTYIAVMDGLTMGGGAGLAFGAAVRVATEKTQFGQFPHVVIFVR